MTVTIIPPDEVDAIAAQVAELLAPFDVGDALLALISVIAATVNNVKDSDPDAAALAAEIAGKIMDASYAGRRGDLVMARPSGAVLS